ncbi:MAG: D-glycero-beta-D-manno-heptose 1-phosphate adenylyltransferase [Fimbriimonadaceae bacterium]|nr:D-glycero-beta-D-manno-heptose 1-phosphate adenylyltransferase [Fimbriimonadaceae bacterium]
MTIEQALNLRDGRRLVFTNGVFDLLHAGHVQYLAEARKLGDLLIVGVNSDDSVRRLQKGPGRPINQAEDRIAVLEALRAVDGAVLFDEDTPETLIAELRPEVHVKGGDYRAEDLPETALVHSYGGTVRIIPFLQGHSTTGILRRLAGE